MPPPLPPHPPTQELPHVLLDPVSHLETFPELVAVNLHTQNQPECFSRLVPEWIRDALHPLRDTRGPSARRGRGHGPKPILMERKRDRRPLKEPSG